MGVAANTLSRGRRVTGGLIGMIGHVRSVMKWYECTQGWQIREQAQAEALAQRKERRTEGEDGRCSSGRRKRTRRMEELATKGGTAAERASLESSELYGAVAGLQSSHAEKDKSQRIRGCPSFTTASHLSPSAAKANHRLIPSRHMADACILLLSTHASPGQRLYVDSQPSTVCIR